MDESVEIKAPARKGSGPWFWVLVAVAVAGFAYVNLPVKTAVPWGEDLAAAQAKARDQGSAVLIDFTTTGCVYCMRMDREVFARDDVAESLQPFETVRINCSTSPDACTRYGVQMFPSFLVVDPDGKALLGSQGYLPVEDFKRFVRDASALVWPKGRVAAADPPTAP